MPFSDHLDALHFGVSVGSNFLNTWAPSLVCALMRRGKELRLRFCAFQDPADTKSWWCVLLLQEETATVNQNYF